MSAPSAGIERSVPQVLRYGTPGAGPIDRSCPLCGRSIAGKRPVFLYGFPVCKKCRNAFANRRQGAFLIDVLLWRLVEVFITTGFWSVAGLIAAGGPGRAAFEAVGVLLGVGLTFIFPFRDAFGGRSPGKWLCGVQVVDRITREPISPGQSYKRNLPTIVPLAGILVPVLQMMNGPRWGDGWANTVVIWKKYAHKLPFDPRGSYCLGCGYDLTGNVSGVCPECGAPVPVARPLDQAPPQAMPL